MDPATLELISDAIKILGPASIAAYAMYKVSTLQSKLKLRELEKAQQFKASEHIFQYYRDQEGQLTENYGGLLGVLGGTLGYTAGITGGGDDDESGTLEFSTRLIKSYLRGAPREIERTLSDMVKKGLKISKAKDYEALQALKERMENREEPSTFEDFQESVYMLEEVYQLLLFCNRLLMQKEIDKVFHQYVQA